MPELPEVETIRRDLLKRIIDVEITAVEIILPRIVKNDPDVFRRALVGNRFRSIERVGKLLVFQSARGDRLLVHLKMTGQLIYERGGRIIAGGHSNVQDPLCLPGKHTRVMIRFANGATLYFNDLRTFGYLKLADGEAVEKARAQYGPEPFGLDFSFDPFAAILKHRRSPIKAVLLDQRTVAGLGNIYVDEVLFRAGVRPGRRAASLKRDEAMAIYRAIRPILRSAIEHRGTTFNNYRDADGNRGDFVRRLKVYGRGGQPCRKCRTPLRKTKVAGRGTHWCAICQK